MSATAEKTEVKVKVEPNGVKRWNHLFLINGNDVRRIFLVFDIERDEVYILYDTVEIIVEGELTEYELTHEEEEAVIAYIASNYEREQEDTTKD